MFCEANIHLEPIVQSNALLVCPHKSGGFNRKAVFTVLLEIHPKWNGSSVCKQTSFSGKLVTLDVSPRSSVG